MKKIRTGSNLNEGFLNDGFDSAHVIPNIEDSPLFPYLGLPLADLDKQDELTLSNSVLRQLLMLQIRYLVGPGINALPNIKNGVFRGVYIVNYNSPFSSAQLSSIENKVLPVMSNITNKKLIYNGSCLSVEF